MLHDTLGKRRKGR